MNKDQFITYLEHPETILPEDVSLLENIATDFPYCQSAQLLYTKGLHLTNSIHYEKQLKLTAAQATDRTVLYRLILQRPLRETIKKQEAAFEETAQELASTSDETSEDPVPTIAPSTDQEISKLEEEILKEAINASIQIEVMENMAELPEIETPEITDLPEEKEPEEIVDVTPNKRTFNQWLKPTSKPEESVQEQPSQAEKFADLVDQFIQKDPTIKSKKTEFFTPANVAKLSIVDDESFVSETLAKIYIKQGHFDKALRAYQHLSLKNPEKRSYFATQIQNLEAQINKNKD
jgi:tetratricopeptide (TPR) repeat protein